MSRATDDMSIRAIAPWFGGKRNLAPEIVRELGPHRAYWEPFCGSMAVLLTKASCPMETVNDMHGDIVNLARVIQDRQLGPKLYRMLRRTWLMEELQEACKAALKGDGMNALDRAFAYFVESWLGRNGLSGTHSSNACFCIRYASGGGAPAKRLCAAVESIPGWHRRMRNVAIAKRDAFELLTNIGDEKHTAIYVDPPYLVKGAKYIHDFKPDDHTRLAEALARFCKTRVVCSYYDHPLLAELYPPDRWTHRKIEVSKALAHQGSRGAKDTRAVEVLLLNGPSYAAQPQPKHEARELF